MPNWKKVIVSGSDASLNSLIVNTSVTASSFSGNFTGSLQGTSSWAINALTASYFSGSITSAVTAETASKVQGGTATYIPLWLSENQLSSSYIVQSGSTISINATGSFTPSASEALAVIAKSGSESYNVISGYTTINNYAQLNIKNLSNGVSASSDIVATANNGSETTLYIDMGINGSNYNNNGNGVGTANDAYLYSTGNDLLIGNATPGKKIIIFNGGLDSLSNARIFIDPSGTLGVNTSDVTSGNPESLFVRALNTTTYNLITAKANVNNYSQINIKNENAGTASSADVVATADNGDETVNFIDMGINGSEYTGIIGNSNDAYLYSTGKHLHIGNATAGQYMSFFVGGIDNEANNKLLLSSSNQHQLTGSLNVSGGVINVQGNNINNLTASYAITASYLIGSVSNAVSASYATNSSTADTASYALYAENAANVGYAENAGTATFALSATSASHADNASFAQTASYVLNAVSASYAINASLASSAGYASVAGDAGTAATALNALSAVSAGTAESASYALNASSAQTASYVLQAVSASYATNALTASYSTTALNVINKEVYSAGIISGSGWSQPVANGTITLPTVQVALYKNAFNSGSIEIYSVTGGTTGTEFSALTDNDTNYICISYNSGTPIYTVSTTNTENGSDIVLALIVYRLGNFIHVLEFGNQGAGLANKLNDRIIATQRAARESGLTLGLSGSNGIVTVSEGVVWNGPYRQTLAAINSQDDVFFKNFHSASVWTYTTTGNFINNEFYDTGINTASVSSGKYLVNWYFRGQEVNDHIYEVFGTGQYDSVSEAQLSTEPALPELITSHGILLGRIIIQSGSTTGQVESAFTTVFQSTAVTAHNDLLSIQGGTAGQYYHLTQNQYDNIALKNINNNFTTSQTITGSVVATTGFTGSLQGTATTASYVLNAVSASFATTALTASFVQNAQTASYVLNAVSSSYALTASYVIGGGPGGGLTTKANSVANSSFTGNPKKATVTFSTPFPNNNYSIAITGEDARSWTIESKVSGSFVINANSNTSLSGTTYWTATAFGES